MKPTTLTKKLTLHRETLRVLTEIELSQVAGGDSTGATAVSCNCPPPTNACIQITNHKTGCNIVVIVTTIQIY